MVPLPLILNFYKDFTTVKVIMNMQRIELSCIGMKIITNIIRNEAVHFIVFNNV